MNEATARASSSASCSFSSSVIVECHDANARLSRLRSKLGAKASARASYSSRCSFLRVRFGPQQSMLLLLWRPDGQQCSVLRALAPSSLV